MENHKLWPANFLLFFFWQMLKYGCFPGAYKRYKMYDLNNRIHEKGFLKSSFLKHLLQYVFPKWTRKTSNSLQDLGVGISSLRYNERTLNCMPICKSHTGIWYRIASNWLQSRYWLEDTAELKEALQWTYSENYLAWEANFKLLLTRVL